MKRIPAFPERCDDGFDRDGMDLWDYYAAHALAGLLASSRRVGTVDSYARDAIKLADAMLAERERRGIGK